MNILKESHKLTKKIKREYPNVDYKAQLGICISYLSENKGEVEMVKLEGTEKQVAWAEDIRKEFLKQAKELKEIVLDKTQFNKNSLRMYRDQIKKENPEATKFSEYRVILDKILDRVISNMENETSCKKFIDIKVGNKYGIISDFSEVIEKFM